MTDVKKLLNKRKFTGEDLGRIEITNMAISFRDALDGNRNVIPFIETDKLLSLINALDRRELKVYNNFIEIHDWITMKYNIAQSSFQQAQLQLKILFGYISEILLTEEFFTYITNIDAQNKPPIPNTITINSILTYFNDNPDIESIAENIFSVRDTFFSCYYLLLGYNLSLDLIADEYGLPDISVFKRDFTRLFEQIKMFNETRDVLYNKIQNGEYKSTAEIKKQKLEVLSMYFKSIDISEIKITDDKITAAKNLLKDFKAFKMPAQDPLYTLLFIM